MRGVIAIQRPPYAIRFAGIGINSVGWTPIVWYDSTRYACTQANARLRQVKPNQLLSSIYSQKEQLMKVNALDIKDVASSEATKQSIIETLFVTKTTQ